MEMELKTKKIDIEISVQGEQCNNCYWLKFDKKNNVRCYLFLDKKLKGNWDKGFKRCKKCIKTFE